MPAVKSSSICGLTCDSETLKWLASHVPVSELTSFLPEKCAADEANFIANGSGVPNWSME